MATFNPNELKRKLREAQRKEAQQVKREIDRVNRVNKRAVDDYNVMLRPVPS
jgi:chromosome segregation ATPase